MLGQNVRKLIIVVDDKTVQYGELLAALISMEDDKKDQSGNVVEIVGIEDGSVEAAVWTDKIYLDNQAQLGSNTKVLFIGDSDAAKSVSANINGQNEFSKYGVYFGSLGNKAAIFTDKKVLSGSQETYDDFVDSYNNFIVNSRSDFIAGQVKEKMEIPSEVAKHQASAATEKIGGAFNKGLKGLSKGIKNAPAISSQISKDYKEGNLLNKISRKASDITSSAVESAIAIKDSTTEATMEIVRSKKEIPDQQYRCGVLAFFIQQLNEFME